MTKINQHRDIPPIAPPVGHNPGTVKSTPAGGEVSRDQWQKPLPVKKGGVTRETDGLMAMGSTGSGQVCRLIQGALTYRH